MEASGGLRKYGAYVTAAARTFTLTFTLALRCGVPAFVAVTVTAYTPTPALVRVEPRTSIPVLEFTANVEASAAAVSEFDALPVDRYERTLKYHCSSV